MIEQEIQRYLALNALAEPGGIVILGGTQDREIPLCELKQSFGLDTALYNRSLSGLSVTQAAEYYDTCVAPLKPTRVFLHLGGDDAALASTDPSAFDQQYRQLIRHIRTLDKSCAVTVVSLVPAVEETSVTNLNRRLQFIAQQEQCEFIDLASRHVWNPRETREILSFVQSLGFGYSRSRQGSGYDLARILFCAVPCTL